MLKRIIFPALWLCALLLNGCAHPPPPAIAKLAAFQPTLAVQSAWQIRAGSGTGNQYLKLTPAINDGKVFVVGYAGDITAIDTQNGKKLWRVKSHVPITSGPAADQHLIFIGTGIGVLYATQQQTGALAWRTQVPGEVLAAPKADGNVLLVKTEDGHLLALNTTNGNSIWSFQQSMPSLILRASSSPQVEGNLVAVGFANGKLAVLSRATGQPLWVRAIAVPHGASIITRMVDIDATPQIRNGVVYVVTYQGRIAALNLQSGRVLWQYQLSSFTGLSVDNNNVYVTTAKDDVLAFDRQTGRVIWRQSNLYGHGLTAPALMDKSVVVADRQGYVYWLSKQDGHFMARWSINKSGVIATPIVNGNSVYIYANNGRLTRLNVG